MPDRLRRKRYGSDLSDPEWATIEPLLPKVVYKGWGQAGRWHMRDIVDGIFYVLKTSSPWRDIPGDLPHWNSVWGYFYRWRKDGTWQRIHDTLRGDLRETAGREREPSAAIIDSQSVKGTELTGVTGASDKGNPLDLTALATAIVDPASPGMLDVRLHELADAVLGSGHGLRDDEIPASLVEKLVNSENGAPEGVTRPPKGEVEASGYDAGKAIPVCSSSWIHVQSSLALGSMVGVYRMSTNHGSSPGRRRT
jgi:transposase